MGDRQSSQAVELHAKKKTIHAAEQDRPDVAEKRNVWKRNQDKVDARRLIFIDETWAKTNMTRRRGRAPCGESRRAGNR